jgi:mycobactin peptide synthetase MbtE
MMRDAAALAASSLTQLLVHGLRHGHAEMLVQADARRVTRSEFEQRVVAQIERLRGHGAMQGTRVLLHGVAAPSLVAMLVACLLEGLVVVPVDATLPAQRKQAMVQAAAPALSFDFTQDEAEFSSCTPGLCLSDMVLPQVAQDAPCYVFFTSGTTGRPKGIVGRRGGLAHFLAWEAGMLGLVPGERVGMLTGLSFDVVLRDLLLPIVAGVTGCVPPQGGVRSPAQVLEWLAGMQVSVMHTVPSLAQSYLAARPAGFRNDVLRHTLFAGEPLTGALVERWRVAFARSAVHNLYGPTETTLAKFWALVPDPAPEGIQSCGMPLPQTSVRIVDEELAPVPDGQLGEVLIRTAHRSLGYLDPPEPSARNFVEHEGVPGYLSGDLGWLDAQGALHLRGRKDHQLKILGTRIEPVGVAALLQAHPDVDDAAVVCVTGDAGDARLVAYFTTASDAEAVRRRLRPYMAERLPAAAVPSRFIALDALPVTANGKLDRSRLPAPASAPPDAQPPEDALAQAVADAMAAALGVEQVGAADDFFALGGDSLAAVQLCIELETRSALHLQPADLLHAPSPNEIASHLRAHGGKAPEPIPAAPRTTWFELSPQQRRYFRTFCAGGNGNWCNMVAVFDLPPATGRHALQHALAEIALKHNSLRLRFAQDERGTVMQSIDPGADFDVRVCDMSAEAHTRLAATIEALRIAEGEQAIALFGLGPLFRATLLLLPNDARKLLWTVHHLVSDGTSQGLFAQELAAQLTGDKTEVPPSFRDMAASARYRPGLDAARAYFRALMSPPYAPRYLPPMVECADPQRCLALETSLPAPLRAMLRSAARRQRCTPYVFFVAAYFRLAASLARREDIAIVTPLSGRAHPQIARAIGDFINLVPLRLMQVHRLPPRELLAAVRAQIEGAAAHQAWQFDELLDDLGIAFDPDRNPLTGFSLNFMPSKATGSAAALRHADRGYRLKYDLLFLVRDHSDVTNLEIQYRAGLLSPAAVERVAEEYSHHLEVLCHA